MPAATQRSSRQWFRDVVVGLVVTIVGGLVLANVVGDSDRPISGRPHQSVGDSQLKSAVLEVADGKSLKIAAGVRLLGSVDGWRSDLPVRPIATVDLLVRVENLGPDVARNVVVGVDLPPELSYERGSARLYNGGHPDGTDLGSDNLPTGGVNIGHYAKGAVAYVWFTARAKSNNATGCPGETVVFGALGGLDGSVRAVRSDALLTLQPRC